MKKQNEFYIGWMPAAPDGFASHSRKVAIAIAVFIAAIGFVLAFQQKKFSTATFEFGQSSEITGIYTAFPVPSLRVETGKDGFGRAASMTIPLVGYGKFGAEGTISALEEKHHIKLDNQRLTLKGSLIYSDGKTLLQIDKNDAPLVRIHGLADNGRPTRPQHLGKVQLTGEIIDPKCYFGVMKPGQGKPHRDCAIRCIAGGMSPVFYVRNEAGQANYYLILDVQGKKLNDVLKDMIAEPVSLEATAVRYDDWVVLYIDSKDKIKRTGGFSWFKTKDGETYCGSPDKINRAD